MNQTRLGFILLTALTIGACSPPILMVADNPNPITDATMDVPTTPVDAPTGEGGLADVRVPTDGPCNPGTTRCGDFCVDLQTDPDNCNRCGSGCAARANAVPACRLGACALTCAANFGDCDGNPANGCETPTNTATNCRLCGSACNFPNAMAMCTDTGCRIGGCTEGFGDCNRRNNDGCEVDQRTDIANCGGCGMPCMSARSQSACVGGACVIRACDRGFENCDMNPRNGCEAEVATDVANCGTCGTACGAGQICTAGRCVMGAACNGNPAWQRVTCTTTGWIWSMDRNMAMDAPTANRLRVLASGCSHTGEPLQAMGLCSLTGTGYVSTRTFTINNCNDRWYAIGGRFTGNCGGHDGDTYRLLVLNDGDCYAY